MRTGLIRLISFAVVFSLGTSVAESADPNLVGWWRFDEGSGTTTFDSSGNGNDGTLVGGATWATGHFGGGIELDGATGYVSIPDFWLTTETITFVIWLNGWKGGDWAALISSRGLFPACEMKFGDNDTLHYAWNNDSASTWDWDGGPVIPQDTWTMLAVTIDPNRATAYVYTDADGLSQGTNEIEHFEQTLGALQIGYSYSSRYVQGIVDEAAVFNRPLTEEEILALVSGITGGYPYVRDAYPADGEMIEETWVNLTWRPGELAVSHDVYFSDSFDDVNDGAAGAFRGNQTQASYVVGLSGYAFPEGLEPGTTYYWRIDEVNDADPNSPWAGPVWSFRIPPRTAYGASPADGAMFTPVDVTLSWTGGFDSKLHMVYFGENFDDVSNATGGIPDEETTYTPGPLEFDTTYYWRVDELDPPLTNRGDVWSFTTTMESLGSAAVERWEDIEFDPMEFTFSLDDLREDPDYPDNPDATETVTRFAWDGPDMDYLLGARMDAWLYVPVTGDYTFWLNAGDVSELWLSTNDDPDNATLIARETWGTDLGSWEDGLQQSEPVSLVAGEKYYISALWMGYFWGDHCQVAWQGPGVPERTIINGSYLSPFEPMAAFGARPANRSVDVTQTGVLRWKPGLEAVSHEIYFGTDEEAVMNATTTSPEYQGATSLGEEVFYPGKLAWEGTFFWRVDEVNELSDASPWIGDVWSFTTAGFLIVEDFEDYYDDDTTGGAIWQRWFDGFGVSANGSQVGYISPPFAEQEIVHRGRQSMPLAYNNTAGVTNSEAELILDSSPRDWTEGGVSVMSIWFRGRAASVGSFTEEPADTFTMTGSGRNISSTSDQFHFAYKKLAGAGTIIARVDSVQGEDEWAKAGVMIRETLEPGSKHALAGITPGKGVVSRVRVETEGSTVSDSEEEIVAPHWVKIERDEAGNFTAWHSANGEIWIPVKGTSTNNIPMRKTVYIGLAVTAADADLTCEAVFSEVTITGNVGAEPWANRDIGIASNVAEPMYVAVSNADGQTAVVTHDEADAALTEVWTQWTIDLSRFSDQGLDLSDVDRIAIGLGVKGDSTATGGSGVVFFDDVTLHLPAPQP
jgi:hypothetical protein